MWWRGKRAGSALIAVCVTLAISVVAAACGSAPGGQARTRRVSLPRVSAGALPGGGSQPSRFVSLRFAPGRSRGTGPLGFLEVAVSDSATGAIIRRLLPASRDGMRVAGLALDHSGDLWITYSRGPAYGGHVAGGDPRPDSCGNEIAIVRAATGRVTSFLRTGNNVLISGAAPSPDGKLLAYRESGCATGFFNSYLRVSEVSTGRSWTIGKGLPRCHLITDPSWTTDGRALVVSYAPAATPAYTGPRGTCSSPGRERLVTLNPSVPQAGVSGGSVTADPGCQVTSAAGIAGGGMLAIEACDGLSGPARLLVLTPRLRVARRITLGRCTDGNELAADRSGASALVSAYLYCNPPGKPGPVTRLWSFRDGRLRLITTVPGDTMGVSMMTW